MSLTDAQRHRLAAKDRRYARLFNITVPAAGVRNSAPFIRAAPVPLPLCEHLENARGDGGCRHRLCAMGYGGRAGVKPCDSCGPRCVDYLPVNGDHVITIDQGGSGIGDGLLGLVAVARQKLDRPDARIIYRVSDHARPWVSLFEGYDSLVRHARGHTEDATPDAMQINAGYSAEWQSRQQTPRWERYAANIGASGVTIPSLREPDRIRRDGREFAGHVLLCPFSDNPDREWPLSQWLDLDRRLRGTGWKTAVVHSRSDRRTDQFRDSAKLVGRPPAEVAGAMLAAACVIGIDSGMAHLSGILGTPTVVIGGLSRVDGIFGCYPKYRGVQGAGKGCVGATPEMVVRAVRSLVPTPAVAALGCLRPFREFTAADSAEQLRHLTDDQWLYEPGRPRYLCSILGTLLREIGGERPDLASLILEATMMARRLNDFGVSQDRLDWTDDRTLLDSGRLSVIRDAVLSTAGQPGDLAELGVYRGGTSKLMGNLSPGVAIHLFDTFAGIPEDDIHGDHKAGDFSADAREVRRFVNNPKAVLHVGRFPEVLPPEGTRYRVVHVDGDTYQTTRAALEYFPSRMVPGGIMVFDDYRWERCPGVEKALLESVEPDRIEVGGGCQAVVRF